MGKKRIQASDEEEELELEYPSGDEEAAAPKKSKKSKKMKTVSESSNEPKSSSKGNVADNVLTNVDGEKFIDIGKKRRVTVRSFKGQALIDIREFYGDNDDLKPGKKGISLSPEQWKELASNASKINELIDQLKS